MYGVFIEFVDKYLGNKQRIWGRGKAQAHPIYPALQNLNPKPKSGTPTNAAVRTGSGTPIDDSDATVTTKETP